MDKYQLVEEKFIGAQGFLHDDRGVGRTDLSPADDDCSLRVTQQATNRRVELRAMGKAINKAVTIAEILKRKMPLHQITALSSCEIVTIYKPLEEGLDTVVNQHYVSCLTITLSEESTGLDVDDIGYQPPLPREDIHPGDYNAATPDITAAT
eukprot:scaffold1250_cov190-Alexandrium_tamarense.AAC.3